MEWEEIKRLEQELARMAKENSELKQEIDTMKKPPSGAEETPSPEAEETPPRVKKKRRRRKKHPSEVQPPEPHKGLRKDPIFMAQKRLIHPTKPDNYEGLKENELIALGGLLG